MSTLISFSFNQRAVGEKMVKRKCNEDYRNRANRKGKSIRNNTNKNSGKLRKEPHPLCASVNTSKLNIEINVMKD